MEITATLRNSFVLFQIEKVGPTALSDVQKADRSLLNIRAVGALLRLRTTKAGGSENSGSLNEKVTITVPAPLNNTLGEVRSRPDISREYTKNKSLTRECQTLPMKGIDKYMFKT